MDLCICIVIVFHATLPKFFLQRRALGGLRLLVNEISSPLLIFMSWLCRVGWDSILVSVSIRTKLEQRDAALQREKSVRPVLVVVLLV